MNEFVWIRIKEYEGEAFKQIMDGKFTYKVKGNSIELSKPFGA